MSWYFNHGLTLIVILNVLTIFVGAFCLKVLPSHLTSTQPIAILWGIIMFIVYFSKSISIKNNDHSNLTKHRKLVFYLSLLPYIMHFVFIIIINLYY